MAMWRTVPLDRLPAAPLGRSGLASAEVLARRQRYGSNDIRERAEPAWRELVRSTLADPMLWFLVLAGVLYLVLGELAEGLSLILAIGPLLAMDFFLHRRTQASVAGLRGRLAESARVVRDRAAQTVPATELVVGDLVRVELGETVPADGLVLEAIEAQLDESSLTGEALPVRKHALSGLPPDEREPNVATEHWALAGTRLLSGSLELRVVRVGRETLYGEIVQMALRGARERTPLQHAVASLVTALVVIAGLLCLVLAWVRLRQGYGWVDAAVSAATLAVAALPEEFPVVLTFFLGTGVYRLARQKALVRRAVSIENIGRVTVICTDKTGTLTEGALVLAEATPASAGHRDELLGLAALVARPESPDPLDQAIRASALPTLPARTRIAIFPFTEHRRRETSVHRTPRGVLVAVVKGAPEEVLARATLTPAERAEWQDRAAGLAARGEKVIAVGARELFEAEFHGDEPASGFTFQGLLAFADPVRSGAREAVARCERLGVRVVMVTGDHPATAASVAKRVGLGGGNPRTVEAGEGASGDGRPVDVLARALPADKLRLVERLRREGEVVAVTGDGVNDVPALQAADVGIAMGERGTRSAREVAAIVLLDDNLGTIARAIAEGRALFRNLQQSFSYLLVVHLPLVLAAAVIPLLGEPLLFLPIHVVWLELVIHPTSMLAFQRTADPERLRAPPARDSRVRFFSNAEWVALLLGGVLAAVALVLAYERSLGDVGNSHHGRAVAIAMLLCTSAAVTLVLSEGRGAVARTIALVEVASAVLLIQLPVTAALFHLQPLHLDDWAIAAAGGLLGSAPLALLRVVHRRPRRTPPRPSRPRLDALGPALPVAR